MTVLKPKPATYADIEALPPHVTGEILYGSLVTQPRPASPHIVAASTMGYLLGPPFHFGSGGPGGWIILSEPEIHLGPHVVVPDIAGWKRERFTDLSGVAFYSVAPDWVCERAPMFWLTVSLLISCAPNASVQQRAGWRAPCASPCGANPGRKPARGVTPGAVRCNALSYGLTEVSPEQV